MKPEKNPNSKCRKFKFRIGVSRVFKNSILRRIMQPVRIDNPAKK